MSTREDQTSSGLVRFIEQASLPVAMLIVVIGGILVWMDSNAYTRSSAEAEHTRKSLEAANAVLSELKDAETGQRGFLLTGKEPYLEPYQRALRNLDAARADLRSHARSAEESARVSRLEGLVDHKLDELRRTIALRQTGGLTAALDVVQTDLGKQTMDEIRALSEELKRTNQERLSLLVKESAASATRVRVFAIAGSGILLILLVVARQIITAATARRKVLIAELERSRADTAKSRDLLQVTLSSIGDAVIVTDAEGRVTFTNPVAQNLTGWSDLSSVGVPLLRVFRIVNETTRNTVESPVEKVIRLGTIVGLANHTILIAADGRETAIDDTAAPIRDESGKLLRVVLVFRDVAERRAAEREREQGRKDLERANTALQKSNADLEHFVYAASHDLQEPLRTIGSFSELIVRKKLGNPEVDEYLEFIRGAAKRMQALIHALLGFSHVMRGSNVEKLEVSVEGVLGEVLWNLQSNINETAARIQLAPMPKVLGHQHHLAQLFQNLIGNAIKYRSDQAPEIHVSAERSGTSQWVFHFRDNGIGFDMKYAERVFGLFQRLHTADKYPGTGIGLAMCKRIVEIHGGTIWVESAPGEGSTFSFTLPAIGEDDRENRANI